jgi:rhodanese-related sulfurtransferase
MNRRRFLAVTAGASSVAIAGCLGDQGYETTSVAGESVPLAPTDDAYGWYEDDDENLGVVDSRSVTAYQQLRIAGAVASPAPYGRDSEDPVDEWATDRRILTYCACPHHLSTRRAASLLSGGYSEVYALDKGFNDWIDKGYPVDGERATQQLPTYEISGRTDPDAAGEEVWVREPSSNQREVATVQPGGEYEVTFHFVEISGETPLVVDAPTYEVRAPLDALTETVVTGSIA